MYCKVFLNILDTTDFINCVAKSMDVAILCTNMPQEEGTETVCKAYTIMYELFLNNDPPIPTLYLREMLGLILTKNAFEFNGNNYLQTHGVAIGHKNSIFVNVYMAEIETNLILQSNTKPRLKNRYIDDVLSLETVTEKTKNFLLNKLHSTMMFTAEISENKATFLDTIVFKGELFTEKSILDINTHYKPETFQYTHFTSCHPLGVEGGFINMRLLRTNSSKTKTKKQKNRVRTLNKTSSGTRVSYTRYI